MKLPDLFFPSFFQEQIEKMYELRVFVLDKEIYPMVIFSQSDKLTEVDFRNYNDNKPNRTAPYKLPNEINKALIKIFSKLNLFFISCIKWESYNSTFWIKYFCQK